MSKIKWVFVIPLIIVLVALPVFAACAPAPAPPPEPPPAPPPEPPPPAPKIVYIGGSYSLTGAYAEDTAAVLAGFEDYTKWINETKLMAPWRDEKFPADVTLELLWRDDELKPAKALPIYEELTAKGMMVYRQGATPVALAIKGLLNEDRIGCTSMAVGPYLMSPPQTIFTNGPLYTDELAAIAEWFLDGWTEDRAPRFAYITADSSFGRSVEIPELTEYIEGLGYEVVGSQYVPMVPTAPPTTQLMWLKENEVDLALGAMINPGSQPTIKEAVRLDMGPHLGYKITFGFAYPCIPYLFCKDMGELGDGVVVGGSFPSWADDLPGVKFGTELQEKYRPDKRVDHTMYFEGLTEVMTQVEALRLALTEVPFEELRAVDVLEFGFYKIKDFDTGGLTNTPLTYGPGDIEGIDAVRLDQVQEGKYVKLGTWECRHLYKHE